MAAKKTGGYKKPKVEETPHKSAETSHKPANHIVETARLASSVEKAKNPGKVHSTKKLAFRSRTSRRSPS